ncbi:MAG: hypothetical protein IPN01_04160 [Deltaproteobacteria bacterium]|nr:hypothetical protein [Deltaproteobacteria bacterium]
MPSTPPVLDLDSTLKPLDGPKLAGDSQDHNPDFAPKPVSPASKETNSTAPTR